MTDIKTACIRIARHGLKLANEGDIAGAQALIKTADALAQGHSGEDVLKAYFRPEAHQKIASFINEIAETPSDVAQFTLLQKKAEAFDALQKQAAAKKKTATAKKK